MDDQDLYDEFGNYIGPSLLPQHSYPPSEYQDPHPVVADITLHQDKQYYPRHQQVYPGAEILVEQEDAQTLQTPIISSSTPKIYQLRQETDLVYDKKLISELAAYPSLLRNVAIAGALHHGKTRFLDKFVQLNHAVTYGQDFEIRWTDSRVDQQERGISIKCNPISLILKSLSHKSYLFNFVDTPGHPDFTSEMMLGLRICDAVILVVDSVEGMVCQTMKVMQEAIQNGLPMILCLSKLDRLILQLKLPVEDSYIKLGAIINDLNEYCHQNLLVEQQEYFNPLKGNVLFSSSNFNMLFTAQSFIKLYSELKKIKIQKFSPYIWGDFYYDTNTHKIFKKPQTTATKRTFVQFVLQPIYKLVGSCLTKERIDLQSMLDHIGIHFPPATYKEPSSIILRQALQQFTFHPVAITQLLLEKCPSSKSSNSSKISKLNDEYSSEDDAILLVDVVKVFHHGQADCQQLVLGRILSGQLQSGTSVNLIGDKYITGQTHDLYQAQVSGLFHPGGRFQIPCITPVKAGNIVLIKGINNLVVKFCTLTNSPNTIKLSPPKLQNASVLRIAIEPMLPSELPKMLNSMRKINREYGELVMKVLESGEHVLLGTGQMMLDCVLHDLRHLYGQVQIKVSDPSVCFSQTIKKSSNTFGLATSSNKKCRLSFLAKPINKELSQQLEKQPEKVTAKLLETDYNWDLLSTENIWSFGPFSNILSNTTLQTQIKQTPFTASLQESVTQGYRWAVQEGPLCDEPMRNISFELAKLFIQAKEDLVASQIIPTARRACYSSFLLASPRIMEPISLVQITCTSICFPVINKILAVRRGFIVNQIPIAATPLYILKAHVPTIQSLGLETDLRVQTSGLGFCQSVFDHWMELEGDPLDERMRLKTFEANDILALPKEIMVKTRRRKGLSETISISKYFDLDS